MTRIMKWTAMNRYGRASQDRSDPQKPGTAEARAPAATGTAAQKERMPMTQKAILAAQIAVPYPFF